MRVFALSPFVSPLLLFGVATYAGEVVEKIKFGHEALDLVARQLLPAPVSPKATTTAKTLTYITPSPSAKPIPITKQYHDDTIGPATQHTDIANAIFQYPMHLGQATFNFYPKFGLSGECWGKVAGSDAVIMPFEMVSVAARLAQYNLV